MASLNQVNLIGYAGADPVIVPTKNQSKMVVLSIGTTERGYRRQDGTESPDKTDWHTVVCFTKLGEFAERYVRKGSLLYVKGRLSNRSYEKDGQKRFVTEVVADALQTLDRKPSDTAPQRQSVDPAHPYAADDCPF